jgi:hypothetical protein
LGDFGPIGAPKRKSQEKIPPASFFLPQSPTELADGLGPRDILSNRIGIHPGNWFLRFLDSAVNFELILMKASFFVNSPTTIVQIILELEHSHPGFPLH